MRTHLKPIQTLADYIALVETYLALKERQERELFESCLTSLMTPTNAGGMSFPGMGEQDARKFIEQDDNIQLLLAQHRHIIAHCKAALHASAGLSGATAVCDNSVTLRMKYEIEKSLSDASSAS